MPRYSVRMTRLATDTLDAVVEVTARNPAAAAKRALEVARTSELVTWEFHTAGEMEAPEVDSVEELP